MNTPMTLEQARNRLASWYGGAQVCLDVNACAELGAMIDALEAAITARGEAVYQIWKEQVGHWSDVERAEYEARKSAGWNTRILYTQPPAPQVDEAMVQRICEAYCRALAVGHNTDFALGAARQAALENPNG